jgi:hypothetical protein
MSLDIETDTVIAVLLADGWHHVEQTSFEVGPYQYGREAATGHDGSWGFEACEWLTNTDLITLSGPLTSILAVRTRDRDDMSKVPALPVELDPDELPF